MNVTANGYVGSSYHKILPVTVVVLPVMRFYFLVLSDKQDRSSRKRVEAGTN